MSRKREIIYEPHPVSPERKAELQSAGYKIIDDQFAPEGYVHPDAAKPARKTKQAVSDDSAGAEG